MATITRQDFFVIGAFVCLIYYCVDATDIVGSFLNSRSSVALGNWSYSIYLWHAPMHFAVMNAFAACNYPVENLRQLSARLLIIGTALTVVALAAFSYKYFEVPIRRALVFHVTAFAALLMPRTFP
jgi:peptidoglycan/LPS O-acetylase OafA/YrhL